ncbi:hypothetical protein [Methylobacterium platani]|uniref:Secreted protein n=2 Tax=Methylobacterium platani TaxID=427683 RepID=A0A179SGE2_9HYPH|nr:hypothetical protein SQ03_17575 [Methylobacterium platani JCM 14648]OAS26047.1 hypothetical protein A5481_06725 [Methylobacterium platani]
MRGRAGNRSRAAAAAGLAAGLLMAGAAQAASYEFVPAPQADLNRVYRVDKATGEVISCQYGLQDNTIGTTLCFGPGEGAGPQAPSEYSLVASRHLREAGVFRVNQRTGAMSICYVLDDAVVCTPQGNAGSTAPAAAKP